jgi:hypothetical protein
MGFAQRNPSYDSVESVGAPCRRRSGFPALKEPHPNQRRRRGPYLGRKLERAASIELASPVWKAGAHPSIPGPRLADFWRILGGWCRSRTCSTFRSRRVSTAMPCRSANHPQIRLWRSREGSNPDCRFRRPEPVPLADATMEVQAGVEPARADFADQCVPVSPLHRMGGRMGSILPGASLAGEDGFEPPTVRFRVCRASFCATRL